LFAQQKTITGVINDENGLPLPQATVIIKGTTKGVLTDFDGKFSIEVAPTDALIVSYVGYSPKEVKVGEQSAITVKLGIEEIEQVLVIGYGAIKKNDATGAVSVVSAEELNKVPVASFDKALQGKASGVMVTSNSGRPGESASIRIRGQGSINMDAGPLIVVDGVFYDGGINSINAADIESFQVLKDASATAIYGARGANGVIIITTKRGAKGATKVNFSTYHGVNVMPKFKEMLNAEQYLTLMDTLYRIGGKPLYAVYDKQGWSDRGAPDTDWQKEITQLAPMHNYSISVSGGNEYSNFSVSGAYYNEDGVLKTSDFNRYMLRANSDFYIGEKKRIKVGESISASRINATENAIGAWSESWAASPIMPIYDAENFRGYAGPDSLTGGNDKTNPLAELMLRDEFNDKTKVMASVYAEIEFLKGLKYRFETSTIHDFGSSTTWTPDYDLGSRSVDTRSLNNSRDHKRYWKADNLLTYTLPTDSASKHHFTILAGTSAEYTELRDLSLTVANGFKDYGGREVPVFTYTRGDSADFGSKIEPYSMTGILGRVLYDFEGKYLFTASIRRDGSSKFGENKKVGVFPSFSFGWKMNEDFFKGNEKIDLLKLRAGWGQTGNQNIRTSAALNLMDPPVNSQYVFGLEQKSYFGAQSYASTGNPDVHWEAAEMINAGIDFNILKNKWQFTAEYYYKKQEGMLVLVELPLVAGKQRTAARPWENIGEVVNKGFEFNIIHKNTIGSKMDYAITGNITTIKNEVIYVPQIINEKEGDEIITKTYNGNPIGAFYGYVYEGIFQNQAEIDAHAKQASAAPGDFKFKDLDGDNVITDNDRTYIGKPIPDMVFGLNLEFNYGPFDISAFINGVYGSDIYNSARRFSMPYLGNDENRFVEVLNYWTPYNTNTEIPRLALLDANANGRISSYFIESGDYLRLRSVQIGYTIPSAWMRGKISRARIYIGGANLYTLTSYSGYDPEVPSDNAIKANVDGGTYPVPRTYTIGAQIDF